jgi:predicted DNA-binding transcriptional regulator YafY
VNANDRRLEILRVLCERKFETISNLANEFGVCIRTVKYDIEALSLSHPICTTSGNGGGVSVVEGYRLGMKYLNDPQRSLLEKLSETLSGDELATMQSILKTFSKPIQ